VGLGVDASTSNLGLAKDASRPKVSESTWGSAWTRPGSTWGWSGTHLDPRCQSQHGVGRGRVQGQLGVGRGRI